MAETVLSTRGQVVIPAEIRRELGLEPSARLDVVVRDGTIVMTPVNAERAAREWVGAWDAFCTPGPARQVASYHDLLDEQLEERRRGR